MKKRKRNVLIIGAGRTGRGMLGEMFYTEGGYDLIFADNDPTLVAGLKQQGWYSVEQKDLITGKSKKTLIDSFQIYHTVQAREEYLTAIVDAEIVLTAIFPDAFDQVAKDLADGINLRAVKGKGAPFAILLGGNFVGHYDYFYPRILCELSPLGKEYYEQYVSLLAINANRKVVFNENNPEDLFALTGDDKNVLMVDNDLKDSINPVPSFFKLTDHLDAFMAEKIWSANLEHCSFGFVGSFEGYHVINQAVVDTKVRKLAYYAWLEGRKGLQAEFGFPIPDSNKKKEEYRKFASPFFEDKINRIARDPIRKLSRYDRFIGPALLCLKHKILPFFILKCAAYGFFYDEEDDLSSVKLQQMIKKEAIENVIPIICGLDLQNAEERLIYDLLLANYKELEKSNQIELE